MDYSICKALNHMIKIAIIVVFSIALSPITMLLPSHGTIAPVVRDPNLKVQEVLIGLENPTGMAFLGPHDILIIEKNKGTVNRAMNGNILPEPLLDVNVANEVERGMLGIAVSKNTSADTSSVFLLYTEAEGEADGGDPLGNRLYKYELINNKLVNPKLLLDLPYLPGPAHNGGVLAIGPDGIVYVVIGNLYTFVFNEGGEKTMAQNVKDGEEPDGRGGIIRVTQDGEVVDPNGILGGGHPLDMYYAYGIRNSFGIAFDHITGNLWDTENGGYDEINLVEPGFNSGFNQITGSASREAGFDPDDLVDFDGRGKYSDPELDLGQHIAPTAITFFHSDKLGNEYENDLFVGSASGTIYHAGLNEERTGLILNGPLADKVADNPEDLEQGNMIFGEDFGIITDLETGPDGYLYVLNYKIDASLFRIVPSQ